MAGNRGGDGWEMAHDGVGGGGGGVAVDGRWMRRVGTIYVTSELLAPPEGDLGPKTYYFEV
jgi:hypothetical protein